MSASLVSSHAAARAVPGKVSQGGSEQLQPPAGGVSHPAGPAAAHAPLQSPAWAAGRLAGWLAGRLAGRLPGGGACLLWRSWSTRAQRQAAGSRGTRELVALGARCDGRADQDGVMQVARSCSGAPGTA